MTQYLITIPGDEAVWEARTDAECSDVTRAHQEFAASLTARGHGIISGGELTGLAMARTVRRSGTTYVVTEGPYAEANEQMGGYYAVECDDIDELLEICGALSLIEPVVEIRPILGQTSGPSS